MDKHSLNPWLAAVALLWVGACSDASEVTNGTGDGIGFDTLTDLAADQSTTPQDGGEADSSVNPDTSPPGDGITPGDGTPGDGGGGDGSGGEDGVVGDAAACRSFGCPCTQNDDCTEELCLEGPDGFICTEPCVTVCPEDDYDCKAVSGLGPDPVSLCVPRHIRACRPCINHDACRTVADSTALCLPAPSNADEGNFCATSCSAGLPCPAGYSCAATTTGDGAAVQVCQPTSGLCTCRDSWAGLELTTDCKVTNTFGSCGGTRSCGANGLTSCAGPVPAAETCNGLDDDCDGQTDELAGTGCTLSNQWGTCPGVTSCVGGDEVCTGVQPQPEVCNGLDDNCDSNTDEGTCNDAIACTVDLCDGAGGCTHETESGWCLIEGACVANLTINPDDTCLYCNAAVDQGDWAGVPAGAACNDGDTCTDNDQCDGSGGCAGSGTDCDDGKPCTVDTCDADGDCVNVPTDACLIGGTCYAAGNLKPGSPCEGCFPAVSTTSWSAASGSPCNDGNACTKDDVCASGTCVGTSYSCSGTSCTTSVCDGSGGCTEALKPGWCEIGGTCYANNAQKPNDPCYKCVSAAPSGWSFNNGQSCNDGDVCTGTDVCSSGQCAGVQVGDSFEGNDTKGAAEPLGGVSDGMDWATEKKSFTATLFGTGDVDWYSFTVSDDVGFADIEPRADLSGLPTGSDYEICILYTCGDGGTSFSCEFGTDKTVDGAAACCGTGAGAASESVKLSPSCDCGFGCSDDSGTAYVRVRRVSGPWTCQPYTVTWGDE